ncbi:MAG TPA: PEGA domain-containing protein [Polyangium sp.]|nr:PEGA domain-containing protein [Polyangium sp.]
MAFHRRAALASLAIACAHACGALTYAAQAQEPTAPEQPQAAPSTTVSPAAPLESESERKERARERFDRGRALYDKQAWGAALAEFSEARKILPTWSSTAWAAQCLKNLARFDEAFDMYAILVNDYGDTLPAAAKQRALEEVESMRKLVGSIEIEGAIPGSAIYVDRQARGEYPLLAPLRVAAGSHFVKVFVEGYEPFETRIDVAGSTTARVVASLRKLDATGILRVVEQQNRTLDVVVDGIVLGKTPLSLRIAPGEHVVFLRGEEMLGTLPARIEVHGDNDAPLRLIAEPLEAELELKLEPFDALVAIDSVTLGKGAWSGRVKPGQHTVEVAASGFVPEKRQVTALREGKQVVVVRLERDPKSPFWRRPLPPPHWLVEFGLGVPLTASIGGIADSCGDGCTELPGFGINPAVRAGYELNSGLSFGASVGYFQFLQSIDERSTTAQVIGRVGNVGTADDDLRFRGFSVGAWGGYSFGEKIRIHARLGAGFIVGTFADIRSGSFEDSDGNPYAVGPLEQFQTQSFFHLTSELRVGYRLNKRWEIVSGLEIPLILPLSTLVWNPAQGFTAGGDGYGYFSSAALTGSPFAVMLPSLALRYDFR